MNHLRAIDYAYRDSPIHRVPAGIKLPAVVLLILLMLIFPNWIMLASAAGVVVIMLLLSRIPLAWFAGRLILFEPMVLGVSLMILWQPGGWRAFVFFAARATLCLSAMLLLSATTPFMRIIELCRAMRVPGLLVTTLLLMHRYLFVLADESQRMNRARLCRSFTSHRISRWRALSGVIAQLFVRASERAERIYLAMCARGWK